MIRLLPERVTTRRPDDKPVILESECLALSFRFVAERIDVVAVDAFRKFLREPAHGGFDFCADPSARQVVVRDVKRAGFHTAARLGKQGKKSEATQTE